MLELISKQASSSSPFDSDSEDWGSPISPGTRMRSYTALLVEAMENHPRFNEFLDKRAGSPTRGGWRKRTRRTFYVIIAIALVVISWRLHALATALESDLEGREAARLEAENIAALVRSTAVDKASESALARRAERRALQTSVAINLGLIGVNCLLAVRGVQIWHLLQRVGFEGWINTIASHMPWTRRVSRVWHWTTLPVRKALSPVRWLTPAGRKAMQNAQREAASKVAAEAAARAAAERAAKLPWRVAYRNFWKSATFLDQHTGGVGSFLRRQVLSAGR